MVGIEREREGRQAWVELGFYGEPTVGMDKLELMCKVMVTMVAMLVDYPRVILPLHSFVTDVLEL